MRFRVTVSAPHDGIRRYITAPTYLHAITRSRGILERSLEKLGQPAEWRFTLEARWYSSSRGYAKSQEGITQSWSLVETYNQDTTTSHGKVTGSEQRQFMDPGSDGSNIPDRERGPGIPSPEHTEHS